MKRGLFFPFLVLSYAVAAPLVAVTPTEAKWFVGFLLAFIFAAAGRAAVLYGREKKAPDRAIWGQSLGTGFAALAIVYGGSLAWPQAPNPGDASFLAGMVAAGAGIGWLGAEYIIEPLLERLKKSKGGGSNG